MKTHILAGDALVPTFRGARIKGAIIINRECLIDGPVASKCMEEFWVMRANYIKALYGEEESQYYAMVRGEYEKLNSLSTRGDIYLWFEYDLFCQINMWFILDLLNQRGLKNVYRVAPMTRRGTDIWKGYGGMTIPDFQKCFAEKVKFTGGDVVLGANLWAAYQRSNLKRLAQLSKTESPCFPYLMDACNPEIERKKNHRPERTLQRLAEEGITDFNDIFHRFIEEEGVYGFSDLQVKEMHKKVLSEQKHNPD